MLDKRTQREHREWLKAPTMRAAPITRAAKSGVSVGIAPSPDRPAALLGEQARRARVGTASPKRSATIATAVETL